MPGSRCVFCEGVKGIDGDGSAFRTLARRDDGVDGNDADRSLMVESEDWEVGGRRWVAFKPRIGLEGVCV